MKVVVTGVAGFIGSNLADRLLADGHAVIGIDNLAFGPREQVPAGVDFRGVDIRDTDLASHFAGCDAIFHLAAKNCIADCQDDPLDTADINVTGTINVLQAARAAGVLRVIHAESSAVYEGSSLLPTPESEMAPRSFYAVSKQAAGAFADAFSRFNGMQLTALRYFGVYGPRQDYRRTIPPVMSAFILALLRGQQPVIYGSGEKRRDFIYVDDVNDFHMRCLLDSRTIGDTYNLGFGTPYSVNEIYARIAAQLQSDIRPRHLPDLAGEAQTTHADITKARGLGWQPLVDLDEGLRRSISYIKENVIANPDRALAEGRGGA
jgi:nucleoside-diphosphate-sugar epimerase